MNHNYDHIDWSTYLHNINFYGAVLNPDCRHVLESFKDNARLDTEYGYRENERNNLFSDVAEWSVPWYNARLHKHKYHCYTREWILTHCAENDFWVRKAIEICKQRKVVLVLFFTPLYQFDRWCSWKGFCEYMQDYDPNILIADYEDFQFPDDSYYGDVHHLNNKGADYFTSYIAKHGLETKKLKDWLAEKGF